MALWNLGAEDHQAMLALERELEEKTYRLSVFQEFCRTAVSASAQEIKDLLLSSISIITRTKDVSLALIKDNGLVLDSVLGEVSRDRFTEGYRETPIGQSFLSGRAYWGAFIGDICVSGVFPLVTKEGILGVLSLHTVTGRESSGDERDYIDALVSIAAVALQQAMQYERAQQRAELYEDKAIHDNLTGLYNRHYLAEYGVKEISRAARHKEPLSIVMFDVDFFKKCNDTCGHSFGDYVLKEIGKLSVDSLREEDAAFRYGGEEFIIVLGSCNSQSGAKMANRLRLSVEQYPFKTVEGVEIKITVSLGVAQWQEGETLEAVIGRADQALYQAKREGRNRVRQWEKPKDTKQGKREEQKWGKI